MHTVETFPYDFLLLTVRPEYNYSLFCGIGVDVIFSDLIPGLKINDVFRGI